MLEQKLRLDKFVTVTVPASGIGFSTPIGPAQYGERWHVNIMSIQTIGNLITTPIPQIFVYRGSPSRINQVDYTGKVEGDTSPTDIDLLVGDVINFEWRNFTVGSIGTAHIIGDLFVPARAY